MLTQEYKNDFTVIKLSRRGNGESLNKRVNNSQIILMGKLRIQGVSVSNIARATGMNKSTVEAWCKRLGLKSLRKMWQRSCECGTCKTCKGRIKVNNWRKANGLRNNVNS